MSEHKQIGDPKTVADLRELIRISGVSARLHADAVLKKTNGNCGHDLRGQAEAWSDALSLIDRFMLNQ